MEVNLTRLLTCRHSKENEWKSKYDGIQKIALSSSNTHIAFLSREPDLVQSIHVFSRSGDLIASTRGDHNQITNACLEFWPDDSHLLLVGDNPRDFTDPLVNFKLWSIGAEDYTYPFGGRFSWIGHCKKASDRKKLFFIGKEKDKVVGVGFRILNTQSGDIQIIPSSERYDSYSTYIFSLDGEMLALGGYRSEILKLNRSGVVSSSRTRKSLRFHAFSPDNQKVITTPMVPGIVPSSLSIMSVPDLDTVIHKLKLDDRASGFSSAAYSPNGSFIATGHADGSLRIWDAYSAACICHRPDAHLEHIHSILFSQTGYQVFTADRLDVMGWHLEVHS